MVPTLLLGVALAIAADPVAGSAPPPAAWLVHLLGDRSYKVRQSAFHELERRGAAAFDALRGGLDHPDAEISERCRRLMPHALELHSLECVKTLVDKPDSPIPEELPGIARWVKTAGTGKESRRLYAGLLRAHCRTLVEIELSPHSAEHLYHDFCTEVGNREAVDDDAVSEPELIFYFFMGADERRRPKVIPARQRMYYVSDNAFLNSRHLEPMLAGPTANLAAIKVFVAWLEQERRPAIVRRALQIASDVKLSAAAPAALRIAADKAALVTTRSAALLGSATLMGRDQLKDLEAIMSDRTPVRRRPLANQTATTEIGDIALGLAIGATEQSPADYGFEQFFGTSSYLSFSLTPEGREKAFEKWAHWRKSQR